MSFDFESWQCDVCQHLNSQNSWICSFCSSFKQSPLTNFEKDPIDPLLLPLEGIDEETAKLIQEICKSEMTKYNEGKTSSSPHISYYEDKTTEQQRVIKNKLKTEVDSPWRCSICQSMNEPSAHICSVCECEDKNRSEILTKMLIRKMELEEEENKRKATQEINISEETKKMLIFYEEENTLAGFELTKHVETMMSLQEKKAIQEWNDIVKSLNGPYEDKSFMPTKRC